MKTTTRLAVSSLKSDKSRSLFTGIAIFLTTALITIIMLGCVTVTRENRAMAAEDYGEHYGTFERLTPGQIETLKLHAQFYNIGLRTYAADGSCKGYRIRFYASDSVMRMLAHFKVESGSYPQQEHEILAAREFFQIHGYKNPQIGDEVTIPVRINGEGKIVKKNFVISGFLSSSEANDLAKSYSAYVSEAFIKRQIPDRKDRLISAGFQVRNEEALRSDEMKEKISVLAKELGISERQVNFNSEYLQWTLEPPTETILFGVCIILLIVFVSVLVIYNIFHVAIIQKIREFGRLKALGASKKQLKKIVRTEGLLLCAAAVSTGLLAGMLILKSFVRVLLPRGGSPSVFSLPYVFLVAALTLLTVLFSIQKPVRLAAKASPVEAIRYEAGGREKKRKGKTRVTVFGLTMSNLTLHRKRTVTTILTMGLSCVLFVVIANVAGNMDAERQTRENIEYGRFRIELDCRLDDKTYPENNMNQVQKENPMGEAFVKKIRSIDGVTDVRSRKQIPFHETNQNTKTDSYTTISVVSEEEFAWLVRNAERGTVDYQNTAAKDGVIHMWDYFLDGEYRIGDTVCGELLDGDRRVPFFAPLLGSCGHSNDGSFTMTEETFQKLGLTADLTDILFVDCESEAEPFVKEQLQRLVMETEHVRMDAYSDQLRLSHLLIDVIRNGCYTFLTILGMIGFMNMANTMMTNILTRKREFGILQAVGMSNRQLNRMLQLEGLVFTAGTLLISLVPGNILGYLAFLSCKENGVVGLFEYHVPALELGALVAGIASLQMILAFVLSRNVKKESMTERMRYLE